jgi:hypothetical protein
MEALLNLARRKGVGGERLGGLLNHIAYVSSPSSVLTSISSLFMPTVQGV